MPSINDLRNDGNNQPFVPYVKGSEENVVQPGANINVPKRKGSIMMSMTSGTERPVQSQRVAADFSHLPTNSVGVDKPAAASVKEDILQKTFGAGGDFDKYLKEKVKNAEDFIEEVEAEKALADEEAAEEQKERKESESKFVGEEDDSFLEEIEEETKMSEHLGKTVDLFADEEDLGTVKSVYNMEDPEPEIIHPVHNISDPVPEIELTEDKIECDIDFKNEHVEVSSDIKEEDILDENDVEVKNTDDEDVSFTLLKNMVTDKIKPAKAKLDISGFTVATKPVKASHVVETSEVAVAKWVLPHTGVSVHMKEFTGAELENLRLIMDNDDARSTLQIIYDHIVSPKPTFNNWLKTTAFDDYDNLFMAIYIACFNGANFLPVDCAGEKCRAKSYITDDVKIKDMVKYKNEAGKQLFNNLYKSEPVESKGLRATEIIPINEHYAIGFTVPSIYSYMIEQGYLTNEFVRKYASMVSVNPFIDKIYSIDQVNRTLSPIYYKEYDNNEAKTVKSKIVTYASIINKFNSDEIMALRAYTAALNEKTDILTYWMPESTCPHCGKVNPGYEITATRLVFTRNQLAALVNT